MVNPTTVLKTIPHLHGIQKKKTVTKEFRLVHVTMYPITKIVSHVTLFIQVILYEPPIYMFRLKKLLKELTENRVSISDPWCMFSWSNQYIEIYS